MKKQKMSKVIQLVTEADDRNHRTGQKGLLVIDAQSKSPQVSATYSAAVLFTIAVWITASVLSDYLLIREVLTTSFILVCLLVFKGADQDRSKGSSDKEFESK